MPWLQFLTIITQVLMTAFVLFFLSAVVKVVINQWKKDS